MIIHHLRILKYGLFAFFEVSGVVNTELDHRTKRVESVVSGSAPTLLLGWTVTAAPLLEPTDLSLFVVNTLSYYYEAARQKERNKLVELEGKTRSPADCDKNTITVVM